MELVAEIWRGSGLYQITGAQVIMLVICLGLLYLGIARKFEPLLLVTIGFGGLLSNIPGVEIATGDGLLYFLYNAGVTNGVFPLLIFMGVGALTDFGPLLANPRTLFLGAAAQFGIFATLLGALGLTSLGWADFSLRDAAAIGIIGGADGPTAIYVDGQLAPELLGAIAIAAYSYMALVPLIQPPIMRALTSESERKIAMVQLREVSQAERILFPLVLPDGRVKLILKEDLIPDRADTFLYRQAPYFVFAGMLGAFAALPFGATLIAADLDVGIYYIIAITALVVVGEYTPIEEAIRQMVEKRLKRLPVVDADGSFVGLFSLRRITHALLPMAAQIEPGALNFSMSFVSDQADDYLERLRRIGEQPVSTLLEKRKKLRFCSPDTPIPQLLQLLTENPTSLPVLVVEGEHQKVVGMVSTWDVLTKIAMHLYGDEAQTDSHDEPGEEK